MTPAVASFAAPPGLARDPLSEIWGDLSAADGAGLLADVRAHGVRQPILVDLDKGTVVDGWTATGWRPWLAVSAPSLM